MYTQHIFLLQNKKIFVFLSYSISQDKEAIGVQAIEVRLYLWNLQFQRVFANLDVVFEEIMLTLILAKALQQL